MDCRYLDDIYELFLLGLMKPKESGEVKEHIERGCPYCVNHLREAAQAVYFLLSSSKPRKPGPAAKAELLRHLHRK
jgi:hypothetical protein